MEWNSLENVERDGKKVAKGLKMVLKERGVSTVGKTTDWM